MSIFRPDFPPSHKRKNNSVTSVTNKRISTNNKAPVCLETNGAYRPPGQRHFLKQQAGEKARNWKKIWTFDGVSPNYLCSEMRLASAAWRILSRSFREITNALMCHVMEAQDWELRVPLGGLSEGGVFQTEPRCGPAGPQVPPFGAGPSRSSFCCSRRRSSGEGPGPDHRDCAETRGALDSGPSRRSCGSGFGLGGCEARPGASHELLLNSEYEEKFGAAGSVCEKRNVL